MYTLSDTGSQESIIKIIGIGGGGCNAVSHMISRHIEAVEFICANTDAQALKGIKQATGLQLGIDLTRGLGAGGNPEIGRQAAIQDKENIAKMLEGADMVFIAAGMGGGTGTGAAPVVAKIAKQMGILTIAVVTKPFFFEGRQRSKVAEEGLASLKNNVDSLLVVPNVNLLKEFGDLTCEEAFSKANDILHGAVQGISDVITYNGHINVDFADVRSVMSEMGMAIMGTGEAVGEDRASRATDLAIHSPLLDEVNLDKARGILVNITAASLLMDECAIVGEMIQEVALDETLIVIGIGNQDYGEDKMRVTVVITGLEEAQGDSDTHSEAKASEELLGAGQRNNCDHYTSPPIEAGANAIQLADKENRHPVQYEFDYLDLREPAYKRKGTFKIPHQKKP